MDSMEPIDGLLAFLCTGPAVNNCNTYPIHADRNILIDPGHLHLFDHVRTRLSRRSLFRQIVIKDHELDDGANLASAPLLGV